MLTTVAMLREVSLFELLDDDELAALAARMDCRTFEQGTVLFDYGDPGGEIFILNAA